MRIYYTDEEIIKRLVFDIYSNPPKYGINDLNSLYIKAANEEIIIDNTINGIISPGTTEESFMATSYEFNDEEMKMLYAIVYAEASEHEDHIESDSMGVASVILNRIEDGKWGTEIHNVISAKGQFGGYKNYKYQQAMNNPDIVPEEMKEAVDLFFYSSPDK